MALKIVAAQEMAKGVKPLAGSGTIQPQIGFEFGFTLGVAHTARRGNE